VGCRAIAPDHEQAGFSAAAASGYRADQAGLSASWTTVTGVNTFNIVSNRASTGFDPTANRYSGATWPNDQYSQCAIITPLPLGGGEGCGPAGRIATAATTMYIAIFNSADSEMYAVVGGSYTQIGSSGTVATNGQIAYLSMVGTTIVYKLAGTTQASVTDSSIASGQAGIFGAASTNNAIVDDWEGGDFGGGGGGAPLFRQSLLNGIGAGGKFFNNPLG